MEWKKGSNGIKSSRGIITSGGLTLCQPEKGLFWRRGVQVQHDIRNLTHNKEHFSLQQTAGNEKSFPSPCMFFTAVPDIPVCTNCPRLAIENDFSYEGACVCIWSECIKTMHHHEEKTFFLKKWMNETKVYGVNFRFYLTWAAGFFLMYVRSAL